MPGPHDRSAPKFDGHPLSLKCFFDEVEALGESCQLNDQELIRHTLRYLSWRDYQTWKDRPSVNAGNWEWFKQDIISLYQEQRRIASICTMISKGLADSDWLMAQGEISRRERDMIFFSGFDPSFREQFTSRLRLKNPDHPLHQPWPMDKVVEAAQFFLDTTSAASEPGGLPTPLSYNPSYYPPYAPVSYATPGLPPQPPASSSYTPTSYPLPAPPASQQARKTFDMSSLEQFLVSDVFLDKLAGKLESRSRGNGPRRSSQSSYPRNTDCAFCSDPKQFMHHCQHLEDYSLNKYFGRHVRIYRY